MVAQGSDYKIEILGINYNLDNTASNDLMTDGRDLPWLQDTLREHVHSAWGVEYRDVVILDPANERPVAAFNLTTHDLAQEANRNALKALLLSVAELADGDGDKLSDFWEDEMFEGDYSHGPSDNTDDDPAIVLLEYAHGSHPGNAASQPSFITGVMEDGGELYPLITFRRRLGHAGGLAYLVERSQTGTTWESGPGAFIEVNRVNPYDGTGTEIVTYRSVQALSALGGEVLLRVRCSLP